MNCSPLPPGGDGLYTISSKDLKEGVISSVSLSPGIPPPFSGGHRPSLPPPPGGSWEALVGKRVARPSSIQNLHPPPSTMVYGGIHYHTQHTIHYHGGIHFVSWSRSSKIAPSQFFPSFMSNVERPDIHWDVFMTLRLDIFMTLRYRRKIIWRD